MTHTHRLHPTRLNRRVGSVYVSWPLDNGALIDNNCHFNENEQMKEYLFSQFTKCCLMTLKDKLILRIE